MLNSTPHPVRIPTPEIKRMLSELHYFLSENEEGSLTEKHMVLSSHELMEGEFKELMLGKSLRLTWYKCLFKRPLVLEGAQKDAVILLHFMLKGEAEARNVDLSHGIQQRAGEHNLWYLPNPETDYEFVSEKPYEALEVLMTESYFRQLAGRYPGIFGDLLKKMDGKKAFSLCCKNMDLTPEIRTVIHQLDRKKEDGPLRQMFLEVKLLELLSLQFEEDKRQSVLQPCICKSPGDVDKIQQAKRFILENYQNPPTIKELARIVGTNEFKLKSGFRELFGNSVYGTILEHRMNLAMEMLGSKKLTISQIAHELGYNHAAHFSTAFRKHFNCSPSEWRKGSGNA